MTQAFQISLTDYLRRKQKADATKLVLSELASILAQDRDNFREILLNAGVGISDSDTDNDLIDKFVENAPSNRKLLLGAAFLINFKNRQSGADGVDEVSDSGVKNTYGTLSSYFSGNQYIASDDEEYSNWIGAVAGLAGKLLPSLVKKKEQGGGTSSGVSKQELAALQMKQSLLEKKQIEMDKQAKARERADRKTRNIMIYGSIAIGILLIGVIVYAANKNRK